MGATFLVFGADAIGKLLTSLGTRTLGDKIKGVMTERRMARLVQDSVDKIVEQMDEYLTSERVDENRKGLLVGAICARLKPLVDDPQQLFAADLDGAKIFKHCHPDGVLPQEVREEQLEQFYTVLFPQIAHLTAGSRLALAEWEAEGFREEFKRLSQLAMSIRAINEKVAEMPGAVTTALGDREAEHGETVLRELAQTLLSNLLVKLDLSPLRAERALSGSLRDHFVMPAVLQRKERAVAVDDVPQLLRVLAEPGGRRILHGGAGAGKTTFAFWLQSSLLQAERTRLALVIRLREVHDIEKRSLLELIQDRAGVHLRGSITDAILRRWHEEARIVIILDGFDEIAESRRDAVEAWITDLAILARRTAILVSSRPLQTQHLDRLAHPWQQWQLLPFDQGRIVDFIERWHRYLPEHELSAADRAVDANALARTFLGDPSLRSLADTPLMLGTLLFVHHRDKKLPSGRVDLYDRYIGAMLGLRDSGLGIQARATRLTERDKRRVLTHLALHFHLNSLNEVNDEAVGHLVTQALRAFAMDETAERVLPALSERTGLIQGPGTWSFMHKTIGEFLVAELICEGTTLLPDGRRLDRRELWAHRHEDPWTAVLFFWAGKASARELEEFLEDLLAEAGSEAVRLCLSLLVDQGDRLPLATQRQLALRVVGLGWNPDDAFSCVCSAPAVPDFIGSRFRVPAAQLRGLSQLIDMGALRDLLKRGALVPADVDTLRGIQRERLTMAVLWTTDSEHEDGAISGFDHLRHVSGDDLASYAFMRVLTPLRNGDEATLLGTLAKWLDQFPSHRSRVLLLLFGLLNRHIPESVATQDSPVQDRMIRLIWGLRDYPVDDEWLRGSHSCQSSWSDIPTDILEDFQDLLRSNNQSPALSGAQHSDLGELAARLMARRAEIQAR